MFKITFLGTGTSQGIPVIGSDHPVSLSDNLKDKRLRCSVLISWDNFNLLIDCGPDFRQQMLRFNCNKLDSILEYVLWNLGCLLSFKSNSGGGTE